MRLRGFADNIPQSETITLAVQLFLAISLALTIANVMGLHKPYWAGMPIWVVSQNYREDLLFRATLRIVGTVVGAVVGLQLISQVADLLLLVAILAVLVGICAGVAHWTGNAYSYGATVAGLTLAVVILPSLADQTRTIDHAIDRVICTFIGVICVTAFTFASTPLRNTPRPPPDTRNRLRRSAFRGSMSLLFTLTGGMLLVIWPRSELIAGAMGLAILSNLASSSVNARPMLRNLAPATTIGVLAAILFRSITPALGDYPAILILLTGGFLAAGALVRAHPRTYPLGIEANIGFLLITEVGTAGHNLTSTALAGFAMAAAATLVVLTLSPLYLKQAVAPVS